MFFSVRVIAAPNGPFKKGVLLDFGFYRTFKKLISISSIIYLYTFTECKEKEEPLHILCNFDTNKHKQKSVIDI